MRNLEDCKAEVFRRSEERIKERKRTRNRVMACCIPLCVLLVAGGLYLRPLLEPMDEVGGLNAGPTSVPEREVGGPVSGGTVVFTSVEVADKTGETETVRNIAGTETADELCRFMGLFFGITVTSGANTVDGAESDITLRADRDTLVDELEQKYGLEESLTDYQMVFEKSTGEQTVFRLHENYLYNENEDCMVILSEEQLSELKALLR